LFITIKQVDFVTGSIFINKIFVDENTSGIFIHR